MQDKKGADFLAIEVKNDNLLIFNSFNLFYLFWEERGYFHDKKKELLLKILKIIIIYSYLYSSCCFYLIVFMIGFEGGLFTVTQFYLILYGVPLSASICFWFYRKKICRYLFW
ncbi:MAG: hypothetical protein ACI4TE_04925, partial [Alphaproteobacteria bacterium]